MLVVFLLVVFLLVVFLLVVFLFVVVLFVVVLLVVVLLVVFLFVVLLFVVLLFVVLILLLLFLLLLLSQAGELEVPLCRRMVGIDLETGDVMRDRCVPGFGVEVEVAEFVLSACSHALVLRLAAVLESLAGGL